MNLPGFAVSHRSVVLAFTAVLVTLGSMNLSSMPRREDPEITIRDALIITRWPGAPAARVEELVTDPLEAVVAEIAEIDTVKSKSMVGISVIQTTAGDRVDDTDQVWDDVRAKVDSVRAALPPGSGQPFVYSDFGRVYEIVIAVYQAPLAAGEEILSAYTPRQLEVFAERIEDELELIDSVARVDRFGVQPERIYIEADRADWAKISLTLGELRELLEARNIVEPGGEVDTKRGRFAINPTGEFHRVDQIRDLVIGRLDGAIPVRLGDLPIQVSRRYLEPPVSLTRVILT